jgi:hypothetical protein
VAALEKALAMALRKRGFTVLGEHSGPGEPDHAKLAEVIRLVEARLRKVETSENRSALDRGARSGASAG